MQSWHTSRAGWGVCGGIYHLATVVLQTYGDQTSLPRTMHSELKTITLNMVPITGMWAHTSATPIKVDQGQFCEKDGGRRGEAMEAVL